MSTDSWAGRFPRHDAALAATYIEAGAWTERTLIQRFRDVARRHPDRSAVIGPDMSFTYAELDVRSDQVATAVLEAGLRPGDAVLLQVDNSAEGVLGFYALLKAGAVPVATLAAHRAHELRHIGGIVGARGHLIDTGVSNGALAALSHEASSYIPALEHRFCVSGEAPGFLRIAELGLSIPAGVARTSVDEVQSRIDPRSVAVFQLSGGTTGTPKVIPRLHAEYWNNGVALARTLGRDERSRVAHVMPFVHNAGVIHALFGAHAVGGCFVAMPFGPPEESLEFLIEQGVDDMMIAGPMIPWVDHPLWEKLAATLRKVAFSGTKLPSRIYDRCTSLGQWIGQNWGMAEGPYMTTGLDAPEAARRDTIGNANDSLDSFRVVDTATGEDLPDGEAGLLLYRGPCTLAGYVDAPEHNAVTFRDGGYLDTGDLARVVVHGGVRYVVFEGRVKDLISRGGEKINAEEIEELLLRHPRVLEAAVVAMPDERLGERACACVALGEPGSTLTLAEVKEHFEKLGVAKFKWPERLELVLALPRTNTLKIDKVRLRAALAEEDSRSL
ncbi:AMP-binding protein [Amycolatopsis rubida]|uniref:AMP-binding protein n=1 Tax=Amycolatopsis rubida TaxID=112413 RepID=A0ABX0BJR1_9PSEU|nr:AMP-binding protein [Amycolatopsis rubida]MYW90763.1 AMP-binding protein [Amycolatopsis rubida]NEC55746.1 AMP-binding protein [Amycolatopsis rubida]